MNRENSGAKPFGSGPEGAIWPGGKDLPRPGELTSGMEENMSISDEAWEQRTLCSDGNCIGVIGSDGRCKECGKAYAGDLPLPAADDAQTADGDPMIQASASAEPVPDAAAGSDDDASGGDAAEEPGEAWENRTLCADEGCIGVVGPDGRCNECGKPYPE